MGRTQGLRVAAMPAADRGRLVLALREVRRAHGEVSISARNTWGSPADFGALREGRLDALVLVGPVEGAGFRTEVIGCRDRHAVVAEDHPLARQAVVRLEHLVDLPTFRRPDEVQPTWRSYWLNVADRGREPRYVGRSATELEALLAIGTGRVVGVAPQGWGRQPGLVTRPVSDLTPAPVVVVTRSDEREAPLVRFVETLHGQDPAELTPAERRVTALVVDGLTDTQIATALSLSSRTVETHVANARRRLGLRSRAHLASVAIQRALV